MINKIFNNKIAWMFIVNKKNRYIKDENIRGKDTMYGIG